MAFTKDGFKKWITTGASGNDEYVLLANGGHKKIADWFTEIKSDTTNAVSVTVGGTKKNITTATLKNSLGLGSMAYDSGSYVKLYTYTIPATGNKGVQIQYQPYASVKITVSGAHSGAQLVLVGTGYGDGGSVRAYFSKVTTFEDKQYTWCLGKTNSCTVEVFSTREQPDYVIVESSNSITFTAISALSDTANTEKILSTNTYSKYALPLSGGSLTGDLYTNKSIYVNHSYENQAAYIFKNTRTADNNSDRADNVLKCIDNNDALMWVLGHFGTGATDSYLYLGYGDYGSNTNLRIAPGGGVTVNSLNVVNQITRDGKSSSWINGRENALLRETKADGYHCVWSLKTNNGSWQFGEYRAENWYNIPLLTYTTDENYSNKSNQTTYNIKFPMATGTVALTSNIPTSLKNPCALTIFNESYDGSSAKSIYNTTFISTLTDGTSNVTDGTMFVTSYAGDDGFSTTDKKNIPYKRKALYLYNYIKGKTDTLYVTALGTDGNYLTWTKNGTTNKVTVPYATKSATATKFENKVTVTGGVLDTFSFTIDGSASSVSATNAKYSCYSSVGSISSTKYHLIAEAIPYALATREKHITFIIQGRGSSNFGLLYAYIRCENSTSTKAKITWIVRNGYPVDYVQGGVFKGTSTSVNTYFDIFLKKTSSYDSTAIRVIDSHGDGSSSKEYALYNPGTNFVYDSISAAGTSLHNQAYTETITAVEESVVNSSNKLATARTLTIGNTGKSFNGCGDVTWTLSEIGAASSGHTHGNITNDGKLSTASVPVITDANKKITTTDYATFTKNLSVFKKDTAANTGGYIGVVPKPDYNSGSKTRFLREDGTWVTPTDTNTHTYTVNWSSVTTSNAYPIAFSPNLTPKTSNNGYNAVLTYNPNTYSLKNNGCTQQYDVTNKCLKFVFS